VEGKSDRWGGTASPLKCKQKKNPTNHVKVFSWTDGAGLRGKKGHSLEIRWKNSRNREAGRKKESNNVQAGEHHKRPRCIKPPNVPHLERYPLRILLGDENYRKKGLETDHVHAPKNTDWVLGEKGLVTIDEKHERRQGRPEPQMNTNVSLGWRAAKLKGLKKLGPKDLRGFSFGKKK